MSYARSGGLGDAAGSSGGIAIDSISPATPNAGPGLQLLTLVGHGFLVEQPAGVNRYPLTFMGHPNSDASAPAMQGTFIDVSPDGTQAIFAVDFGGVVDPFGISIIVSDYLTEEQANYTIQTRPGAVDSTAAIAAQHARQQATASHAIGVVVADTAPIASVNGPAVRITGGYVARNVSNGGVSAPRGGSYPGPGLLEWNGTAWQFYPVDSISLATLDALFGDIPTLEPNLTLDPFGLPLPSPHQPYPVPYFYADGSPAYSPWFHAKADAAGTGVIVPSTALPPTYTTYFQIDPASPVAAGDSSAFAAPVSTSPTPTPPDANLVVYTGQPVNDSAPATTPPANGTASTDMFVVDDTGNATPVVQGASAPPTSSFALLAGLVALGIAGAVLVGKERPRRR